MTGDVSGSVEVLDQNRASWRQATNFTGGHFDLCPTGEEGHELATRGSVPIRNQGSVFDGEELQAIRRPGWRGPQLGDTVFGGMHGDRGRLVEES